MYYLSTDATHRGPGDGILQSAELGDQLSRLVLLRDGSVLRRERVPEERKSVKQNMTKTRHPLTC